MTGTYKEAMNFVRTWQQPNRMMAALDIPSPLEDGCTPADAILKAEKDFSDLGIFIDTIFLHPDVKNNADISNSLAVASGPYARSLTQLKKLADEVRSGKQPTEIDKGFVLIHYLSMLGDYLTCTTMLDEIFGLDPDRLFREARSIN